MIDSSSSRSARKSQSAEQDKYVVDYSMLIESFLRFKWFILFLVVVCIIGSIISNRRQYVPMYESVATFTVGTETSSSADGGTDQYNFYYALSTTSRLADAFPRILISQLLADDICDDLGLTYLPVSMSTATVEDSNMFTLTVRGRDPEMVYKILLSAIDNMPSASKHIIGNIRVNIISAPQGAPTDPYNQPNDKKAAVSGLMVGVIIGLLWVCLYSLIRQTIRTKDDIRTKLNMDTVGVLPAVLFKRSKVAFDHSVFITNDRVGNRFQEAVRVLRNTMINKLKHGDNVVMFTSTAPSEGKSTVIGNMALSLVDIGKNVLLIDADLRKPTVMAEFEVKEDEQQVVSEDDSNRIVYVKRLGLSIMTFKSKDTKYWTIVESSYLHKLFQTLRTQYDYVLVDTPPCGLISDPLVIAQEVDAALYVIMQDTIRVSRIRSSIINLSLSDVPIMGCILNGTPYDGSAYGGYSSYGKYGFKWYGTHHYGYSRYGRYGNSGRYSYSYEYDHDEKEEKKAKSEKKPAESPVQTDTAEPEIKD